MKNTIACSLLLLKHKGTSNNSLNLSFLFNNLPNPHPGLPGSNLWLQCVWEGEEQSCLTEHQRFVPLKFYGAIAESFMLETMMKNDCQLWNQNYINLLQGCGFLSSFENMTQPSTVHLLTSSVLSGLKKNRTESGRANAFRASQMYVGDRKERMPKNNQAGQCPNISFWLSLYNTCTRQCSCSLNFQREYSM